jgi:hypothetical protein
MSSSWMLIVDSDEASREQLRLCEARRPSTVRGAIRCDDRDNADAPICAAVDYFPAFCNEASKECVYGRRTHDEMEALATLPATPAP